MAMRAVRLLACLAVLPLVSCNKPAAPPAPAVVATAAEPAPKVVVPSCAVESAREHKLADGTELRVWNLKANGLKRLTVRLLVATDGRVQVADQVEYKWDEWEPAAPEASGQLVLLIQDGKAFGAKEKRLPLLALDLQHSPPHARVGSRTELVIEGEWHARSTNTSRTTPLSKKGLVYAKLFVPKADTAGSFSLSSNPDEVGAESKDGRMVIGVVLEWEPR